MEARYSRFALAAAWCLIIIACVLRVERFCIFRSLWLDELYLADNVAHRSMGQLLFEPLEHNQAAPPGYLLVEKWSVDLFGDGERSLRWISLAAGIASGPMFFFIARRMLKPAAGVLAVAFFTVLGPLVYYSNEAKPYELDGAVSLAITLAIFRLTENPGKKRLVTASSLAILGVLLSFPSIFILAGVGGIAWLTARGQVRKAVFISVAMGIMVFVLEHVLLFRSLHDPSSRAFLVEYWNTRGGFPHWWPLTWIVDALLAICRSPAAMWFPHPAVALCAIGVGAAVAVFRSGMHLQILAPLALVFLAACFREYPFADRLMLFYTPMLLILLAAGIESLWTNGPAKIAAICLVGFTFLPTARLTLAYFFVPTGREESFQTYQYVAEHWHSGDHLYLSHHAQISYEYYHARAGLNVPDENKSIEPMIDNDPSPIFADAKRFAGIGRVWLVQVHTDEGPLDEKNLTLSAMIQMGKCEDTFQTQGAGAWLFDCRQ